MILELLRLLRILSSESDLGFLEVFNRVVHQAAGQGISIAKIC
jgi:hypothetical protein